VRPARRVKRTHRFKRRCLCCEASRSVRQRVKVAQRALVELVALLVSISSRRALHVAAVLARCGFGLVAQTPALLDPLFVALLLRHGLALLTLILQSCCESVVEAD
jgi:hypothetical protein